MRKTTSGLLLLYVGYAILSGCDITEKPDPGLFLQGRVVDSTSQQGIAKVLIGRRDPQAPDTLVFVGDSVDAASVRWTWYSDSAGDFRFSWEEYRDTSKYRYLLAYKSGYSLWRYDRSALPIRQVNGYTDEITIVLPRK